MGVAEGVTGGVVGVAEGDSGGVRGAIGGVVVLVVEGGVF